MYFIHLLYDESKRNSYLEIKQRDRWKTKSIAINHAKVMSEINSRAGIMSGLVCVEVEDEFGEVVKSFPVPEGPTLEGRRTAVEYLNAQFSRLDPHPGEEPKAIAATLQLSNEFGKTNFLNLNRKQLVAVRKALLDNV